MEELKPKDSSVNANYALQVNKLKAQIRVRFVPKNMQMTESQLLQWWSAIKSSKQWGVKNRNS